MNSSSERRRPGHGVRPALRLGLAMAMTAAAAGHALAQVPAQAQAQAQAQAYAPAAPAAPGWEAAKARYAAADWAGARQLLLAWLDTQAAAGAALPAAALKLLAASQLKLGDDAGYAQTLERLIRVDPQPGYWADLLARRTADDGFAPRLQIDALRLARQAGALTDPEAILGLADLALRAGLPAEAQSVLEAARAAGHVPAPADAAAFQALLQRARQASEVDKASLVGALEPARRAPDGAALFRLGQAQASHGEVALGLTLMDEGLRKGLAQGQREARLRLGALLWQHGQATAARVQLQAVQAAGGTDGAADLARWWQLLP